MPELTRSALIDAAARAIYDEDEAVPAEDAHYAFEGCRTLAEDILGAALPLIAAAIEASHVGDFEAGREAAGIVRSLIYGDDDD